MTEIEVVLAVSARDWPDRIHRFLADHGGARVRAQVLSAEDAVAESYQVLVIDDICSFLTPRLVDRIRRQRRTILGVFDPGDSPAGKERLIECGVDLVIEADADGDEFVIALRTLALSDSIDASPVPAESIDTPTPNLIVVGGPPGGVGATELAIAWTDRLAMRSSAVLVDVDETAPAVAQRLGLQLLPNLRTALDALQHRPGTLTKSMVPVGRLVIVTGLSGDRDWMEVRPSQVVDLLRELGRQFEFVVANCGSHLEQVGFAEAGRFGISRQVVAAADHIVAVGNPTPVGVSRLIQWLENTIALNSSASRRVVVNRRPASRYRQAEIVEEIDRVFPGTPISYLPADHQVEAAAWAGQPVKSGSYVRAVRKLVDGSRR